MLFPKIKALYSIGKFVSECNEIELSKLNSNFRTLYKELIKIKTDVEALKEANENG